MSSAKRRSGKDAVVIGAGFGGLSAAALLARDGFRVTVLEKNPWPGGRAGLYESGGFKFDMGPSWYLMPEVFERFFALFGRSAREFYAITRLDPSYRIYFGPGDHVDLAADLATNLDLFERLEPGAREALTRYLGRSEYQYNVSIDEFLYRDYRTVFDFFNRRMLTEGRKLNVFENLDRYTKRYFGNERLRKILEYSMVFLGGAPKNTPAIYSLMSHVDFNLGVWYPEGGMHGVARALVRLGETLGVKYALGSEVTSIEVERGRATRVVAADRAYDADVVVANGDYHHVETRLLAPRHRSYSDRYWTGRTVAPSAFILYLGLDRKVEGLRHHTLSFDHDWMRHFDDIFDRPGWPDHPSYYVCCPSKTDPEVAPDGCENLFVLVPVAPGLDDSDALRVKYRDKILAHLEALIGEPIREHVVVERTFSHRDFAGTFNAFRGTALGLSHTLMQTACFRPARRSKKVGNLYFTGQYTHPGIGVPMTLISSQLTGEMVAEQHG